MQFKDIVGQQDIADRLAAAIDSGRVSHAQMLLGDLSVGMPMALAYMQYLCCENRHDGDSCGECPSCKKMASLMHPDLHFVFPNPRQRRVDQTSELRRLPSRVPRVPAAAQRPRHPGRVVRPPRHREQAGHDTRERRGPHRVGPRPQELRGGLEDDGGVDGGEDEPRRRQRAAEDPRGAQPRHDHHDGVRERRAPAAHHTQPCADDNGEGPAATAQSGGPTRLSRRCWWHGSGCSSS